MNLLSHFNLRTGSISWVKCGWNKNSSLHGKARPMFSSMATVNSELYSFPEVYTMYVLVHL